MGQKILLSALVLSAPALLLCNFASAREWPNDMRQPVTHPIIGAANVSQVDPAKLKPEIFRQLRNYEDFGDWAKYSRDDMAAVEKKALEGLPRFVLNNSFEEVSKFLGLPNLTDGPEPDLRSSPDLPVTWYYRFGYAEFSQCLEFRQGKCVACRFRNKSDGDHIAYIFARLKKYCIGKSEAEVEELFHTKLHPMNQVSRAPDPNYKFDDSYGIPWQPPPPGPPPDSKHIRWYFAGESLNFHFTQGKCDWVGTSVVF